MKIKAKDLVEGDLVDLARDKYADPKGAHPEFESEFATVAHVDHELEVKAVPVIFRRWPHSREYDGFERKHVWMKGSVIALFPTLPGTHESHTFASYEHVGQHGAADLGIIGRTKLATPEEYADLKAELEAAPYHYRLKVYDRMQRGWARERSAELRRSGSTVA